MVYFRWIYKFYSFILVISYSVICAQSDVPRPRGVSLSKASLYSPTKDFTCFDGTVTIPFSYVNDDYCDCFDGSDEPGTSACLNGVFHCTNAGHRSQNIPTSRVNDGICDCCDGTDEYAVPGTCQNTCEELGKEARAEAERMAELLKAGSQIRMELIEKGNKKRNDMAEELSQLENDKTEAEKIKEEKEAIKSELEAKENEVLKVYREAEEREKQKKNEEEDNKTKAEATEHFTRFDSDSDGHLTIAEIQTRSFCDKDKDGEVSEEEAKYFLAEHDSVDLDTFITQSWPLIKPFLMLEHGLFRGPKVVESDDHEPEHEIEGEEAGDMEHEDIEDVDQADIDPSQDDHEEEAEPEPTQQYDPETQQVVNEASEARRQLVEAERTVREIDSNIRSIKQNLEKDYGPQQEYTTLDGQCFEHEDKEYVYRLCMFDKVTQRSKNGGSEVGLGNWGEWAGSDGNQYAAMKYTNGMGCWNGPNRVTTVNVNCGLENKINSVTEPFRCEYKIELSTPAACDDSRPQHASHDEL
ncbi:unnamed protein product [Plutella xylostella]|uniref:Glucosidase 2 subunit beta n=1 Tax=Plutella xylostella TaxID=51655 RepID=A0A8S4G5X4_PLUXY|nr:unnamed protein product [Plutella xylostella]